MRRYSMHLAKWSQDRRQVFFFLSDSRVQPYYYSLIYHFYVRGYNILLQHNPKFIAGCTKAGRYIFELPSLKIGLPPKDKGAYIYVTDNKSERLSEHWRQVVLVDANIFSSEKPESHVQMPFPINPEFYHNDVYKITEKLRSMPRKLRVFFSGNQDPSEYDHTVFKDFFHILSRKALIDTLCEKLAQERLIVIDKDNQTSFDEIGYLNKFILIKWTWTPSKSTNLKSRIDNQNWFTTLAKSDFFVAAPGIRMPMCFNVVEAMSVGCIPIIEYANHFSPKLEHRKNCISFSGKEDLIRKMNMVFEMDKAEIRYLRENVIEYYDQYLAPGRLCDVLENRKEKEIKLYLYATEISYEEYLKSNK